MPIVRLPGGELRDEIRQPLYDTITFDNASTVVGQHNFFQDVQTKLKPIETNLKTPNQLETAVSFRVQGLCLDAQNIYEANASILPLILERSALELQIGEKIYWTGQSRLAAGRVWQHVASAAAPVVMQEYGFPAVQPVILVGRHSVDINPLQTFTARWTVGGLAAGESVTPAVATRIRYMFSLKGLLRRPVQ